ncbi:hypothetical protein QYF36_023915 [Acer negundo]|nr:hypothetical protein QYF36_023915 [Acer negundo]
MPGPKQNSRASISSIAKMCSSSLICLLAPPDYGTKDYPGPTPRMNVNQNASIRNISARSTSSVVNDAHQTQFKAKRSYSVSSSDNEGRCSTIANCLTRRSSLPAPRSNSSMASTSKVTPQPSILPSSIGMDGPPRLVRSRAVRRDLVRDWNFDEVVMER